ncbi:MFS transporter [Caulobacter sp. 602-1]|nr:MFS transporter [Caulobacter sp. 602-1]
MVAYVLSFIDRQILSLLIAPIQADLRISDTQFGLLSGLAFALFYALMGLPIASLSDSKSRPLIIAAGVAFWSLATVGCGLARNFAQLFLARVCVGAGEAALTPATYSLISDLFPKDRLGRAVAVYSLGSFLGAGIAFLVGGAVIALVSAHGVTQIGAISLSPWQLVFILVGLPGLPVALLVRQTIREPFGDGRRPSQDTPPFSAVLALLGRQRRIFVPHIAGFMLAAMALFAVLGWSPAFIMRRYGLSPAESGVWLGLVAVFAGGGGCLASGWLMDAMTRAGRANAPFLTGIVGATGTALAALPVPFAPNAPAAFALVGLAMFFASFPMPPSTAVIQIAAPPRLRSRVAAIFIFFNSLIGLAVGNGLIGYLNDHVFHSPKAVGLSMAIVMSGAGALAALILSAGAGPFARFVTAAKIPEPER